MNSARVGVAVMFAAVVASADVGESARALPNFGAIDAHVREVMDADRIPGLALTIVHAGEVVHQAGFGVSGPEGHPVTAQTPFLLGSMSKSFTAVAVMQLVESGRLKLDTPVKEVLPWFEVRPAGATPLIRVRNLLDHTSGLARTADAIDGVVTLDERVRALRFVALDRPVGSSYEYSSANYQILGRIVEVLSSTTFGDAVRRGTFEPLQMSHSFVDWQSAVRAGAATGHRLWFGFPVAARLEYESDRLPTAALISSSEDLGKYMAAQLGHAPKRHWLTKASVTELHRPSSSGEGFSYAMGWRVGTIGGARVIHHGGMLPHFRGKMVMLPDADWGVVVLTNVGTFFGKPSSHRLADDIARMLLGGETGRRSWGLGRLHLLIALGMVLVTLAQLKKHSTFARWQEALPEESNRRGRLRSLTVPVAIELVWPLALLVGLPHLLGVSWFEIARHAPDMTLWLSVCAALGVGLALRKIIAARRLARRARGLQS
jgi:CubicO group peptidase (beta-lactamase class C family)